MAKKKKVQDLQSVVTLPNESIITKGKGDTKNFDVRACFTAVWGVSVA